MIVDGDRFVRVIKVLEDRTPTELVHAHGSAAAAPTSIYSLTVMDYLILASSDLVRSAAANAVLPAAAADHAGY